MGDRDLVSKGFGVLAFSRSWSIFLKGRGCDYLCQLRLVQLPVIWLILHFQ